MNISALVIDFSRVLIFANADVPSLNRHHDTLETQAGYRVLEHFRLNTELLEFLRLISKQVPLYLFTDGHLHTLPDIAPSLQGIFREQLTAESFGYKKTQAEAYLALAYKLGYAPAAILFIDDTPANLTAAQAAGLHTYQYQTNPDLISVLSRATS